MTFTIIKIIKILKLYKQISSWFKKRKKKIWPKITKSEISRNEAKKLYKELIQKDFDALKRENSNNTKKNNILEIFENFKCNIYWCLFALQRGA